MGDYQGNNTDSSALVWLLRLSGKEEGPYSTKEVRAIIDEGKTSAADGIKRVGAEEWKSITRVKGYEEGTVCSQGSQRGECMESSFDVFVSHSHRDKHTADALVHVLEEQGLRCWIAPRDIMPGAQWSASIMSGLAECRALVLIFSEYSNDSQQVLQEVERAVSGGMPIIPFKIQDIDVDPALGFFLGTRHWLDAFDQRLEEHLKELGHAVKYLLASLEGDEAAYSARIEEEDGGHWVPPMRWVGAIALFIVCTLGAFIYMGSDAKGLKTQKVGPFGIENSGDILQEMEEYSALRNAGEGQDFLMQKGPVRFHSWLDLAKAGNPMAQFMVALMYSDGIGVPVDEDASARWFKESARQKHPAGLVGLAWMYAVGKGVPQDRELQLTFNREAAGMGDCIAMNNLGFFYKKGLANLEQDLVEASNWYRKSAVAGNRNGMWELSKILITGGEGVPRSLKAAKEWREKARLAGEPHALAEEVTMILVEQLESLTSGNIGKSTSNYHEIQMEDAQRRYEALGLRAQLFVLGDWRIISPMNKLRSSNSSSPFLELHLGFEGALIGRYRESKKSDRAKLWASFSKATSANIEKLFEQGEYLVIKEFWEDSFRGINLTYQPGLEYDRAIKQLGQCAYSLLALGYRDEGLETFQELLDFCDNLLNDRPWDWYSKNAYFEMCFSVAEMLEIVGEDEVAAGALERAWGAVGMMYGQEEKVARNINHLPRKGEVPAEASESDKSFFLSLATKEQKKKSSSTSNAETGAKMLKYSIPTQFGAEIVPTDYYVPSGSRGYREIQDQFRWMEEYRGGLVAQEVHASFRKLRALSQKHEVDFGELVLYSLNEASKEE